MTPLINATRLFKLHSPFRSTVGVDKVWRYINCADLDHVKDLFSCRLVKRTEFVYLASSKGKVENIVCLRETLFLSGMPIKTFNGGVGAAKEWVKFPFLPRFGSRF
ncbi:hypothetical protein LIER_31367 [Lithospermum erythrorhizon]|uniref:Uncharacterized protein n=1 Tax=Lithospermum erythrorhizon TaxID=34254 RepID=A0AAV3RQQ1_LITER